MDVFEVNGIKYQKKPEPQSHRRVPPMLMGIMMMAEMVNVNIIEEYGTDSAKEI